MRAIGDARTRRLRNEFLDSVASTAGESRASASGT
jgi:hypothetical protein